MISGKEDAANNFARGRYSLGKEYIDYCMEKVLKMAEKCDNLQGFMIYNSIGGGTGSGMASYILE